MSTDNRKEKIPTPPITASTLAAILQPSAATKRRAPVDAAGGDTLSKKKKQEPSLTATRRIVDLTPTLTGGVINGRVISKTTPKAFNGGTVFNFVIHDETREINVVAPGTSETTDKLYERITVDKCYAIAVFGVRNANRYNPTNHKHEVFLKKVQ